MILSILAALLLTPIAPHAAAQPASDASTPQESAPPVTILISIDGGRADYLDRGVTPALSALAGKGVTGPMHPSFPSKTFPNHWTLVTGLRPDEHGITANNMEVHVGDWTAMEARESRSSWLMNGLNGAEHR